MSTEIKNNLFRFVTLRNPQLIDKKEEQPGFVFHPDEKNGKFFSAIKGLKPKDVDSKLKQEAVSFESAALKTRTEARRLNEPLYLFSSWLMRHKNTLTFAEIREKAEDVSVLKAEELLLVWDNLIYQTIAKKSTYVREAMIQLLVANQFLNAFHKFAEDLSDVIVFTEDQEKEFVRRANAAVVMSKLLIDGSKYQPSNTKSTDAKHQKRLEDLVTSKYDVAVSNELEKALKAAKKSYDANEQKAYKTALENHQKAVDAIIAKGRNQLVEQWDVVKQAYIQVEQFVHEPLPKFTYQKSTEIGIKALQAKLSSLSYDFLMANNLSDLDTFDAILKALKTLKKSKLKSIDHLLPKRSKTVVKNGAKLNIEDPFYSVLENFGDVDARITQMLGDNTPIDTVPLLVASDINQKRVDTSTCYTLNVIARAFELKNGSRNWSLMIGLDHANEFSPVTAVDQSLSFTNNSNVITSTSFMTGSTIPNHSKIGLFSDLGTISMPDNVGNPILSGTITLANGNTIEFSETIVMQTLFRYLSGSKLVKISCKDNEEPTEETPSTFGKLYGVTNLGIADFRRVEQEVCCYVPGEVSHIENVMAREYKERSTRSLTSSEFTTEQTDERERENLTDTTSTERNEMQSEVATVLNEDQSQSYGGNASVRGKIGKNFEFGADAYFDNASSSSSSNSNTQAQTYAQEVTERAMERIVQKTQTKRTSRILKEFEENTSHGFDNRKGENHVTGVYRWVDKIYKNTLINYGKRLMYEFAIPEPSKFFKEAIWKTIDTTGQVESGVILPELPAHPSTLGVTSASVLGNEDSTSENTKDYRKIAAEYNAEVKAIPDLSIKVSEDFYEKFTDQGVDSNLRNGKSFEVEIPEGYVSYRVKVNGSFMHEGGSNGSKLILTVGDDTRGYNNTYSFNEISYNNNIDGIEGKLPISFTTQDIEPLSLSVVLECRRKVSFFEQWQNETYNAIMEAYYDRVQEYNDAMREKEANKGLTPEQEKLSFNPLQNKSIMLRELKRVAIELIIGQNKTAVDNFNPKNETTGISEVNTTEAFQTHASTVKFFEQAFDWDIMAYVFYPYFYADKANWKQLFQSQDAADPLFQAFLQSGMARTVVPVRPGFEHAVNWYMTTGEIWNGQGLVTDQDDDLYVSIAEEMQTVEGIVEGTWETRLPTALTILQAGSIGLKVEGLPCNTECDHKLFESDGNPIIQTNALIGEKGCDCSEETTSSENVSGDDSAGIGMDLLS